MRLIEMTFNQAFLYAPTNGRQIVFPFFFGNLPCRLVFEKEGDLYDRQATQICGRISD